MKKPTRMISSSPEVLRRVEACSNELGGHRHRHVHLGQGRAKAAPVYPRELGMKICVGIAAQKKLDCLGLVAIDERRPDEGGSPEYQCR